MGEKIRKIVSARQRRRDEFVERTGTVTGLLLWEYLGGPWKLTERFALL